MWIKQRLLRELQDDVKKFMKLCCNMLKLQSIMVRDYILIFLYTSYVDFLFELIYNFSKSKYSNQMSQDIRSLFISNTFHEFLLFIHY